MVCAARCAGAAMFRFSTLRRSEAIADAAPSGAGSRMIDIGREGIRDMTAGFVAAVVLIANIVSFAALMFPGTLAAGIPTATWAMLIGSCIGGIWIALATSLPPLASGIDSPTGAVLVVLSAAAGSAVMKAGGSPQAAVQAIMLIFTAATLVSGATLYGLGLCRWGAYFRFVPYFVVGGFLAATGWFLVAGGVRMTTGHSLSLAGLAEGWSLAEASKLAAAVAALGVLLAIRRWVQFASAIPAALLAMWLVGTIALDALGLADPAHGWYLPSLGAMSRWSPLETARASELSWPMIVGLVPQLLAVAIVALISLVTKVSSLEVARQGSANLDRELRAHGLASLIAAPFGGLTSSLQVGTSRLLEQAGGATRMSGVFCALILGLVGIANFNLPGLIPIPVVAGVVFYLGYAFIVDALKRPFAQRAWLDLALALAMMIVCVQYGYLTGVLVGLVCGCVIFAVSYARFGVVRRHVTRAEFTSFVDRSREAAAYLRDAGDAIQVYWLSGYIFFGSSEGMFERIRSDVEALAAGRVTYVILDFGAVPGTDASAIVSLAKLRSYCDRQGVTLVYCGLSPHNRMVLERGGFLGGKSRHRLFADLTHALAWCEDELLAKANLDRDLGVAGFEAWLQRQLGAIVSAADLLAYLERKDTEQSQILYREGEPSDTIDFVAEGNLAIDITGSGGKSLRVRRIMTHAVVGEMGFFRRAQRSATVSSDGPASLFTLTRANLERMRRERPELASAFDDFILRVLADRVDFANRAVVALSH